MAWWRNGDHSSIYIRTHLWKGSGWFLTITFTITTTSASASRRHDLVLVSGAHEDLSDAQFGCLGEQGWSVSHALYKVSCGT